MATEYNECYRPQYHITPEKNWLNDPNGLVFCNGRYHVFYQYNPDTKFPGNEKYWAHVSSSDLVHWKNEGVALSPDRYGSMWSGSAVEDKNNTSGLFDGIEHGLVAFYTVTGDCQQQAMAYSADEGKTWTKYQDGAPVIASADDPLHDGDFRDPKVFWHEESGKWMMIVAGGPVRFFSSANLKEWTPEGTCPDIHTECPDLFRMRVAGSDSYQWVLSCAGVSYRIGDFRRVDNVWTFVSESEPRRFNFGPDVYAGQTFSGTGDRVIMIQWMTDVGYAMETGHITPSWSGALTLPYELTLKRSGESYEIETKPVRELETLRKAPFSLRNTVLCPDAVNSLLPLACDTCEIHARIRPDKGAGFSLAFRIGNGQKTSFTYDPVSSALVLDRTCSGRAPVERFLSRYSVGVRPPEDNTFDFRLYLDRSSVEIFAMDGRYPFTALLFPDGDSAGLSLSALFGSVTVEELSIWPLSSMYDRAEGRDAAEGLA